MKREELKCQSKRLQLIAVLSAPTQNYEVVQTIPLMSACTLELGCLTVYVYIWASNFEEWLYCPYIFFIFPLNSFSHSRDSQLTASSSYQPSLVGPSKVRSWMKGPSSAHPVSDIIREPVGCCNLQQWRWSLSKSISCTEQLNKWPCHSLAHRSSDWMKFWQKSNLLYRNPKEIAEKYEKALRHIPCGPRDNYWQIVNLKLWHQWKLQDLQRATLDNLYNSLQCFRLWRNVM